MAIHGDLTILTSIKNFTKFSLPFCLALLSTFCHSPSCHRYCNNHVAPTELEDILQTHPAVAESLVFGIKEPTVQELISAVIVLRDDAGSVSEEDVKNFVNGKVNADYKKIRGRVLFRKSVPRNTSGKLLRREMRRWAEEEAARETM